MQRALLLFFLTLFFGIASAQHTIKLRIAHDDEPIPYASVVIRGADPAVSADSLGIATLKNLAPGRYSISVSSVGFQTKMLAINVPSEEIITIELEHDEEEEEEVIIRSTRTSRTIDNIPTRVETIVGEEVDEKSNMRPANVTMLLNESTGIRVQQTSATSANASIRIQGLDGRYTQILKDGLPNYSGFASGLSILEIPPLDLHQVEVIKGPASTLFGGGAIAGVINFITKEPDGNYARLLFNQSHIGQTNIAAFMCQRQTKWGFTLMATANRQRAYDVDDDHFTEVPKTKDYTISPKIFFYPSERAKLVVGHTLTTGERRGGDVQVVNFATDAAHTYLESNKTIRNNTTIEYDLAVTPEKIFVVKQSLSFFNRELTVPGNSFGGTQYFAYTDASYLRKFKKHTLITGVNFIYDNFREDAALSGVSRHEKNITAGAYLQDTWDASEKIAFENGIRVDVTDRYGVFVLPRLSVLYRISDSWHSRIGAGMGYKLPTIFREESESLHFRDVAPLATTLDAEKSYGGTADINFRARVAPGLEVSLNHMFFYTTIVDPIILQTGMQFSYANAGDPTISYGFETNLKFIYKHSWKLFAGFTFNETEAKWKQGNTFLPLVPRDKLNLAFIYEKHDFLKVGLEAYRTGKQFLSNDDKTPSFWIMGFMVEKPFKNFSFYINFENFTDERQSNYKPVVSGPHTAPEFDEIWNHTEGFVVNGGIKIRI